MKLEDETQTPVTGDQTIEAIQETDFKEERPLPNNLRYLMVGLLVIGVVSVVTIGVLRQTSVKPPPPPSAQSCKDPVTENRLRDTLKQTPNDFATLVDWGKYNISCEKNYPTAIAALQRATELADDTATSTVKPEDRLDAHFQLGVAYLYNSNLNEAQGELEKVVQADPQNTFAMLILGGILVKDHPDQATGYLKKVIELEPGSDAAKEAQSLLDSLNKRPGSTPEADLTPSATVKS
ncbi:MAG TPA: tetratricopeptide repeat protein [Chloroflexia bacterium]|nr:tetratricopeptide repeat protein [Chloroflexia bacterium]